jgi:hypothetical protein
VQFLIRLTVVVLFLLSTNILEMMGTGYSSSGGLVSIHPSTFLAVACIGLLLLMPAQPASRPDVNSGRLGRVPLVLSLVALCITLYLAREKTGGSSAIVVTYVTPALLLFLLPLISIRTSKFLDRFIGWFFVVNSLIVLTEYATGWRLLPFYAGPYLITNDPRPTGLIGHPLPGALLTGAWLLLMTFRQVTERISLRGIVQIGIHALAMVCYGARAATVIAGLGLVAYLLRHSGIAGKVPVASSRRALAAFFVGGLVVASAFGVGVTDILVDRFYTAEKSDKTRFEALFIVENLTQREWMLGVESDDRDRYLAIINSPFGVEIAPLALVFNFGLPVALGLLMSFYWALFKFAEGVWGGRYAVVYFILTTATSLSISSRTVLVSQFLVLLYVARTWRPRGAKEQKPNSRPEVGASSAFPTLTETIDGRRTDSLSRQTP